MQKIEIFDTTLRDGAQTPFIGKNFWDRFMIAKALANTGVDVIEIGFGANDVEYEWMKTIAKYIGNKKHPTNKTTPIICSLARVLEDDVQKAYETLKPVDPEKRRIHVFIGTSEELMSYSHGKREQEVLRLIKENVTRARKLVGKKGQVQYSSEDSLRTDFSFLVDTIQTAIDCGASVINVPDTTGFARPDQYHETIEKLGRTVDGIDDITLSAHIHNDSGQAVSGTLKGIESRIRQVEGTVLQLGERAGNADWMTVVMNLVEHKDHYGIDVKHIDTKSFYNLARLVSTITGEPIPINHPIVGRAAFAESSGIHVKGVIENSKTYFVIDPKKVGREKEIVLGQTSGANTVAHFLQENGYGKFETDYTLNQIKAMTSAVKKYATEIKDSLTDIESRLFADHFIKGKPNKRVIELVNYYTTNSRKGSSAHIDLMVDGKIITGDGTAKGEINAFMEAMKDALGIDCELAHWKENAVYHGKGAPGFEILDKMKFSPEENKLLEISNGFVSKGQEAMAKSMAGVLYKGEVYMCRGLAPDIGEANYEAITTAFDAIYRLNDIKPKTINFKNKTIFTKNMIARIKNTISNIISISAIIIIIIG